MVDFTGETLAGSPAAFLSCLSSLLHDIDSHQVAPGSDRFLKYWTRLAISDGMLVELCDRQHATGCRRSHRFVGLSEIIESEIRLLPGEAEVSGDLSQDHLADSAEHEFRLRRENRSIFDDVEVAGGCFSDLAVRSCQ